MYSDNYLFEKDKLEDNKNVFLERKIFEVNDTNNGSYSGQNNIVKYQLSQLFNLNTLMNFSNAYLYIPLVLKVKNFKLSNPDDALKLFSLKAGSIINSAHIRINGKTVSNYSNNLGELMEFNYMTKKGLNNVSEFQRVYFSETDENYIEYSNNSIMVSNNTNDVNGYSRKTNEYIKILEQNKLFVQKGGYFNSIDGNAPNTKLSYVVSETNTDLEMRFNYYLKLSDIHPIFNELGISRCLLDMEIGINCGNSVIKYIGAINRLKDKIDTSVKTDTFSGSSNPIYFNPDAIFSGGKYWDNNAAAGTGADVTFTFDLSILSSEGTRIYIPMLTLNPSVNEIYIKDSMKTLKFIDYNYFNLDKIYANSNINFTLSNSILNQKYLLIIPQMVNNKMSIYNSSVLNNGPIPLTNLQIVKGSSIFNQPLLYTYDTFLNYIDNNENVNGGVDWMKNIFTLEKFTKYQRLYFFDLSIVNNDTDVGYNLIVQFKNSSKLEIKCDFYVLYESQFMFNKLNGTIGNL